MLDELLGRAELKAEIEALEEANERLEAQLEAERERRADAVSDRQRAQERGNRLEDRIAELEDRVGRLREGRGDDDREPGFRRVETAGIERTRGLLDRLDGVRTGPEGALTAVVDGDVPDPVREVVGDRAELVRRTAPAVVVADDAGLVCAVLSPPVTPEPFCGWGDRFRLDESWFLPTGRIAFGLVRADTFALGIYEDGKRVGFEGFESDVGEAHSKGGFSQSRFERRRDEQVAAHLDRAREALADRADVDRTVLVGDRAAVGELADRADVTGVSDATGEPEAALSDGFHGFWTTRVRGL